MPVITTTVEALVEEIFLFGRALKHAMTTEVDDSGLASASVGVLAVLATEGECRQTELANRLCISQSALSRQIAELVEMGMVVRHADPDDGRASRIRVSESGTARISRIRERRAARLRDLLGDWSEDEALLALRSIRHLKDTFTDDAHGRRSVSHLNSIAR